MGIIVLIILIVVVWKVFWGVVGAVFGIGLHATAAVAKSVTGSRSQEVNLPINADIVVTEEQYNKIATCINPNNIIRNEDIFTGRICEDINVTIMAKRYDGIIVEVRTDKFKKIFKSSPLKHINQQISFIYFDTQYIFSITK